MGRLAETVAGNGPVVLVSGLVPLVVLFDLDDRRGVDLARACLRCLAG
jgi:hypothetical protein